MNEQANKAILDVAHASRRRSAKLRKYRYFQGQVTLAVLKVLAKSVRRIHCEVKLNDWISEPVMVDQESFMEALDMAGDDEIGDGVIVWVSWNKDSLTVNDAMSEESPGHYPAEVWKDIDKEPPRKKK